MNTTTTLRFCHYEDEELAEYARQTLKQLLGEAEAAAIALRVFTGLLENPNANKQLESTKARTREELENRLEKIWSN
ncbi:hypothetical protein [Arachidicoccus soli]|nr:hypothetical protein [Arachidicoccus soli]